jgi:hypothetical protein
MGTGTVTRMRMSIKFALLYFVNDDVVTVDGVHLIEAYFTVVAVPIPVEATAIAVDKLLRPIL